MPIRGRAGDGWWGPVLDTTDPRGLSRFYADLLGWEVRRDEPGWVVLAPPSGRASLAFQRDEHHVAPVWPAAPGQTPVQAHLDVEVDDLAPAVDDAVALGARVADFQPQDDVRVLLDPSGHPFCLYLGSDQ